MRLRVAIQHGSDTSWTGRFKLSNGELAALNRLDRIKNSAPPILLDPQTVAFRRDDGHGAVTFDVDVTADLSGAILFELTHPSSGPAALNVPLIDLVEGKTEQVIPGSDFTLTVARIPGDALRVRSARKHLVFSPGEKWSVDVVPHLPPLEAGAAAKLELKLYPARTRRSIWRGQQALSIDGAGRLRSAERIEIPVPDEEGAYDLVVTLSRDGLRHLLKTNTAAIERTVQFAVVANQTASQPAEQKWREIIEFDTSEPQWWNRLTRFPAWQDLPGSFRQLFGENFGQPFFRSDRSLNQIEGDGWLALPLPVLNQGTPHRVEIEYPHDAEQTMAVTLVERDPAGEFFIPTIQSGFRIDPNQSSAENGTQSILFWPRTRLSYLILSNKNADLPVEFGRVRVAQSNGRLIGRNQNSIGQRRSFAHFVDPNLVRPFGGTLAIDPVQKVSLTDWPTFLQTGQHLVDYLKYSGLSGAAINVLSRDGQLTPNSLVDLGAQIDSGRLFRSGQDSVPKDVLECYFRLFDREQLQLIPTVRLDMILPLLEKIASVESPGIWLVNAQGKLFTESRQPAIPRYNVLDERVQTAIRQIVAGIVERYGHHDSFGGLAIELDDRSYACLPGAQWAYDSTTIGKFLASDVAKAMKIEVRSTSDLMEGPLAEAWQTYRVELVTNLYRQLAENLSRHRPDSSLYLLPADLLSTPAARRATANQTRRDAVEIHLAELGLDLKRLNAIRGVVAVRPLTSAVGGSLVDSRPQIEMSQQPVASQLFASSAAQIARLPMTVTLPKLQGGRRQELPIVPNRIESEVQPTRSLQLQSLSRALVDADVKTVFVTQRQPSADSLALARWSDQFCGLPAQAFDEVELDEAATAGPLRVRTYSRGEESFVYAVNRSPWPVRASIALQLPPHARLDPLRGAADQESIQREQDHWMWTTIIQPFDLRAITTAAREIKVLTIENQLPPDVRANLQAAISALAGRVSTASESRLYDKLSNARFDMPASDGQIPGWQLFGAAENSHSLDGQLARSGASLRLDSRADVATLRSDPFPAPTTGRLSMHVWLRRPAQNAQPSLRLAIEGELYGQPYYRFASVAAPVHETPATGPNQEETWSQFVLQIDDLPDDGLSDLRVRFDLMGPGSIWIEDVELYDLSFTRAEQRETSKIIALADLQLREGRLTDCWQTLNQFWPRYILKYVTEHQSELAAVPQRLEPIGTDSIPPPAQPTTEENAPPAPSSPLKRMRDWMPELPWSK